MVMLDMLIVKSNNPQERERISCIQLHARLQKMLQRCEDEDYLCKPAVWRYVEQRSEGRVRDDFNAPMPPDFDAEKPGIPTSHACTPGACALNKHASAEDVRQFHVIIYRVWLSFFQSQVFQWICCPVMICGVYGILCFLKDWYVSRYESMEWTYFE
jgi:hypothetical protein